MAELELTRTPGDRKMYVLDGVGTLRLHGWSGRAASAEAVGRSWELARRGLFQPTTTASDAAGTRVGEFRQSAWKRDGRIEWAGRELQLRPASVWRQRYALVDGGRELAVLDGRGWGKRPVMVTVDDPTAIDAGLLLFAVYVVRGLAEDASSASSAGGVAAATTVVSS